MLKIRCGLQDGGFQRLPGKHVRAHKGQARKARIDGIPLNLDSNLRRVHAHSADSFGDENRNRPVLRQAAALLEAGECGKYIFSAWTHAAVSLRNEPENMRRFIVCL